MAMKARVAHGAMALGLSRIAINLAGVLALIVLARLLTPQDFGLVAIGSTVLGIVMALTELSLGSALIQRPEVLRGHVDSAWTLAFLRALTIAAAFAAAAWPLAVLYGDMRLAPVFLVSGATGAMAGLINPRIALSTKEMRFGPMLTMQVSQKLAGLAIAIGLALYLRNYWAMIAGTAIGTTLATLLGYLLVPYRPRFTLSHARDLMRFSGWLFFSQAVNVINWRFDQLVIGLALPKAQLGLYAMADNLAAIPSRETTAPVVQALFPSFSQMQDEGTRLRDAYLTAQGAIALAVLPLGIGLALLAEPVVQVALGDKWLPAAPLMQLISLCYAVQSLASCSRPLAMAKGDTRGLFVRELLGLGVRIPTVLAGLALGGLIGMAGGRLASAVIGVAISLGLVKRILGLSFRAQFWAHRRTLAAVLAMSAAVLLADFELVRLGILPLVRIATLTVLGGTAFFGALALLWLVDGRRKGAETELVSLAWGVVTRRRSARS